MVLSHILKNCICLLYKSWIHGCPICQWFETSIYLFTVTTNYLMLKFSKFKFPMPLESTACNVILPLEKVTIRNPLLLSLHCKITFGCWSDQCFATQIYSHHSWTYNILVNLSTFNKLHKFHLSKCNFQYTAYFSNLNMLFCFSFALSKYSVTHNIFLCTMIRYLH